MNNFARTFAVAGRDHWIFIRYLIAETKLTSALDLLSDFVHPLKLLQKAFLLLSFSLGSANLNHLKLHPAQFNDISSFYVLF